MLPPSPEAILPALMLPMVPVGSLLVGILLDVVDEAEKRVPSGGSLAVLGS